MAHHDALLAEHPWIAPKELGKRIDGVMNENAGWQSKRRKLIRIVDEAAAAIYPHTPCGAGCSHCCKTSVIIHGDEAREIAKFTGRSVRQVPIRHPDQIRSLSLETKYLGVACPFLVDDKCSIYSVRPYVCRQQHSLDDTPAQCDTTKVAPTESSVPHFNLKYLEFSVAYVSAKAGEPIGDIREFFEE